MLDWKAGLKEYLVQVCIKAKSSISAPLSSWRVPFIIVFCFLVWALQALFFWDSPHHSFILYVVQLYSLFSLLMKIQKKIR